MQCRLVDLAFQLNGQLLTFCIELFRKIYLGFFKDNDWREKFYDECEATNQDCRQLLENIYILSCPISFRELVRDVIIKNATAEPTMMDKCNLQSDDNLLRKRVKKEKKTDDGLVSSAKIV